MGNLKNIILVAVIVLAGYLIYDKLTAKPQIIEVPVRVEVPVPAVEGSIEKDTIGIPVRVEVENPINKKLLQDYIQTKDSLEQLKLYQEAITTRVYSEVFEDTIQRITVESTVQGKLLDQDLNYFIKPRTVRFDTIIKIPVPTRVKLFVGAEIGMPLLDLPNFNTSPIVKANFFLKDKRDNIISTSVSTDKRVWLGYAIKL